MAKKAIKNSKFSVFAVLTFSILIVLLAFHPTLGLPFVNRVIRLPKELYLYVILPFAYYFGGYVFELVFFKNAGLSVSKFVRTLLFVLALIIFILLIFFFFLFLQDNTFVGNIIKITLQPPVRKAMFWLMERKVLIFIGGIFLYHTY